MSHLLPAPALLSLFLLASVILAVTPGPAVLFIVTRSAAHGLRAGLVSVAAIALGNLGSAVGASLGLAAILKASAAAFTVVKLAGAGYLIYLAIAALRRPRAAAGGQAATAVRLGRLFRDGALVALLNPKTALFFAAFLPQFITPGAAATRHCVALGVLFVLLASCTDSMYALAAALARTRIARFPVVSRVGSYAQAGVYASLGLYAAFSGSGTAKRAL